MIAEVRKVWQFFRDRRPETYDFADDRAVRTAASRLGVSYLTFSVVHQKLMTCQLR